MWFNLLREQAFVIERNGYRWAYNMKRLLGETCAEVSAPEEKQMAGQERANLHQGYRHILTRGVKRNYCLLRSDLTGNGAS